MKTKQQIKSALRSALNSNFWNAIKNSLVGSELISYATEYLYQDELITSNVVNSVYPNENATIVQLAQAANFVNSMFSKFTPASVSIKIDSSVEKKVYAPYTLSLNKGSVSYFNYDYVSSDDDVITLFQGTPTCVSSDTSTEKFSVTNTNEISLNKEYGSTEYYSYYVKLSKEAIPDSVRVYKKRNDKWDTLDIYKACVAGPNALMYKLKYDSYMNLCLYFGNNLWGKIYDTDSDYFIYYVDATSTTVDTTNLILTDVTDTSNASIPYSVLSYKNRDDSMSSASSSLAANMAKNGVISTRDEIESFVKSFPYVQDCKVKRNGINKLTIAIKAKDESLYDDNMKYNDISENLSLYGELVTEYECKNADACELNVNVYILDNVSSNTFQELTSNIDAYIREKIGEKGIGDVVDLSTLSSELYNEFKVKNAVKVYVGSENLNSDNMTLAYMPQKDTIRVVPNGEYSSKFYVSDGSFFKLTNAVSPCDIETFSVGNFEQYTESETNEKYLFSPKDKILKNVMFPYHIAESKTTYSGYMSVMGYDSENRDMYTYSALSKKDTDTPIGIKISNTFGNKLFFVRMLNNAALYSESSNNVYTNDNIPATVKKIERKNGYGEVESSPMFCFRPSNSFVINDVCYIKVGNILHSFYANQMTRNELKSYEGYGSNQFRGDIVIDNNIVEISSAGAMSLDSRNNLVVSVPDINDFALKNMSNDYLGGVRIYGNVALIPYFSDDDEHGFFNYGSFIYTSVIDEGLDELKIYHDGSHPVVIDTTILIDNKLGNSGGRFQNPNISLKIGDDESESFTSQGVTRIKFEQDHLQNVVLNVNSGNISKTISFNLVNNIKYKYIVSDIPTIENGTLVFRNARLFTVTDIDFAGYCGLNVLDVEKNDDGTIGKVYASIIDPVKEETRHIELTPSNMEQVRDIRISDNIGYFKDNGELVSTEKLTDNVEFSYCAGTTFFSVESDQYIKLEDVNVIKNY